jgi:hypothetical protein
VRYDQGRYYGVTEGDRRCLIGEETHSNNNCWFEVNGVMVFYHCLSSKCTGSILLGMLVTSEEKSYFSDEECGHQTWRKRDEGRGWRKNHR